MIENTDEINNNNSSKPPGPSQQMNYAWPRKRNWVKCDVCNVYLTSNKLMEIHVRGKKHNIVARKVQENEWNYTCHICDVRTNGRVQLDEHIAGKIHKSRVEGLKGCDDLKFYFLYTAVATLLLYIFVYYLLYFMFMFIY